MERAAIDVELARRLVAAEFPDLANLWVGPVVVDGWDNRTFRLGDDLLVRLPTAAGYVAQVDKEHTWLPVLRDSLTGVRPTSRTMPTTPVHPPATDQRNHL